jgi:hypothetical protein
LLNLGFAALALASESFGKTTAPTANVQLVSHACNVRAWESLAGGTFRSLTARVWLFCTDPASARCLL